MTRPVRRFAGLAASAREVARDACPKGGLHQWSLHRARRWCLKCERFEVPPIQATEARSAGVVRSPKGGR